MNLKTGITTILLSSVYFLSGCSEQSIEADIYKNEEVSNTVNSRMIESDIRSHTFSTSDARYIIEAFATINQSMDLECIQEYFYI